MTKEQIISELRVLDLRAVPTVMTEDMGLQYDYVSEEGAGTGFGGMGRWPAHQFQPVCQEQWKEIRDSIEKGILKEEQLSGTGLDLFASDIHSIEDLNLSAALKGLLELPENIDHCYYCLYDTGGWFEFSDPPRFFETEEELKEAFADQFVFSVNSWEEMTEDELQEWYDRIHDDLSSFAFCTYEVEE